MKIAIITEKESIDYSIKFDGATNDGLCRAIANLEVIKEELLGALSYDYEIEGGNDE